MSDLYDATFRARLLRQGLSTEEMAQFVEAVEALEAERDEAVATNLSQYERMVEWCKRAEAAEERSRLQAEALSAIVSEGEQHPTRIRQYIVEIARAALALSEPVVCVCSCCVESRNRLANGRTDADWWCSCPDYPPEERCDCDHCISIAPVGDEHAEHLLRDVLAAEEQLTNANERVRVIRGYREKLAALRSTAAPPAGLPIGWCHVRADHAAHVYAYMGREFQCRGAAPSVETPEGWTPHPETRDLLGNLVRSIPAVPDGPPCPICWRRDGSHVLGCSVAAYLDLGTR